TGEDFMGRTMVGLAILIIICAGVRSAMAGDKIDVPKVVTKSDAEKILGVPVKDAKGRNQNGKGGYYDSEWTYHAIEGDKALMFDVLYAGETPRRILLRQCFPCYPPMAANRPVSTVLVIKSSSVLTRPAWQCCMFSRAIS